MQRRGAGRVFFVVYFKDIIMNRLPIFSLLLSLFSVLMVSNAWAAGVKEFQLKDGSRLTGELVEVTEGRFVVQSASLGRVELDAEQVVSMDTPGGISPSSPSNTTAPAGIDLQALMSQTQQRINSNPALLEQVRSLSQDPELSALASDPAFVRLLMSGDLQAIQQDPRMQQLMSNPRLQGLVRQLSGGL